VAYWGVRLLLAVSPESLARAEAVRFDARLLGFALAVTVLTGLLFGVVPALRASRANPSDAMREGARGNTGGRASRRARGLLVASQLSLAVVLLVGAGLLLRSFVARQRVPLGFDAARVETFEVHLPVARYDSAERRVQFHAVLGERLRTLPGVARVGATSWLPANGDYHRWGFEYLDEAGRRASLAAQVRVIEGDLLEALSIPLRRGRRFTAADRRATPGVALVSQSLARRAYGARDPVGQRFSTGGREWQVVGVVGDVASVANGTRFETVYLSHAQFADDRNWALTYVVKAAGAGRAGDVVGPARRALAALDPALVLHRPRTMDAVLARHRARDRFTLLLMATFAGVALSLAAVGVYGVLSYAVTQRTHEIGVRMALGARPGQLRAEVIAEGLAVAGAGVAVGLGGALALGRVLQSLVYGVSTRDVTVFAGVALLLGAVVLAAASLPARRATRVHPLEALRGE
jgi:putative ABC transport system permease protein